MLSGSRDYMPLVKVTALVVFLGVVACAPPLARALLEEHKPRDGEWIRIAAMSAGGLWLVAFLFWLRNSRS